jgi:hypothetical protein
MLINDNTWETDEGRCLREHTALFQSENGAGDLHMCVWEECKTEPSRETHGDKTAHPINVHETTYLSSRNTAK